MHSSWVHGKYLTWGIFVKNWFFSFGDHITGKHHLLIKINSVTQYLLRNCLVLVRLSPSVRLLCLLVCWSLMMHLNCRLVHLTENTMFHIRLFFFHSDWELLEAIGLLIGLLTYRWVGEMHFILFHIAGIVLTLNNGWYLQYMQKAQYHFSQ